MQYSAVFTAFTGAFAVLAGVAKRLPVVES